MSERFTNVIHAQHGNEWASILEGAYLVQFFQQLRKLLGTDFQSYRFLIINHNMRKGPPPLPISGDDVILIWLSDETGHVPEELTPSFKLILKSYWPLEDSIANIHPFPLGGSSEVIKQESVAFAERTTNVFYSGNFNAHRINLYRQFSLLKHLPPFDLGPYQLLLVISKLFNLVRKKIPKDFSNHWPSSYIRFTDGFGKGLSPADYAAKLADSKIAICPHGFASPECIRHFEVFKLGAVAVSCPLPPNKFYKHSPIIQLSSWRSLDQTINDLLNNPHQLIELGGRSLEWWQSLCSGHAMAQQVSELLSQ